MGSASTGATKGHDTRVARLLLLLPSSTYRALDFVSAARRLNAIKWTVVERMVWAWLLTIPVTGSIAFGLVWLGRMLGWSK